MYKARFILILTLIISLFSACGILDSSEETAEFTGETVQEELDGDTVVMAVRRQNAELCDTVENEEQKADCKAKVSDAETLEEAVERAKLSDCDKIKQKNTSDKCKILVNEKIKELNAEEEAEEQDVKREELSQEAYDNGNKIVCNEIEDSNQKITCIYNVIAKKVRETGNLSLCDGIGVPELIENCKEFSEEEEV